MPDPVILVTGSTDGIGKATVRELAGRQAEVILHGRNPAKGSQVIRELKGMVWNRNLDLAIADFTVQEQIRRMAEDISSRYSRLDVLINNAGTYEKTRVLTPDGIETTFAVNYLAPFLLTHELLPLLMRSAPSRVLTVASIAHHDVRKIDWENLQGERNYDPFGAYALSKFADVTFSHTLARKVGGMRITAHCLHPGVTATKMLRAGFPGIRGSPPARAAKLLAHLALSPDLESISGAYFEESIRPGLSSALSRDRSVQERLWRIAEGLTGADYPALSMA